MCFIFKTQMPFTLSHAIAVYPFKKFTPNYLSVSGLVMGSMAPDFEFFLRFTLYGVWGHTFWGIFLFNLPVSILLCLLFHGVVKRPLIQHLPTFLYVRFYKYANENWLLYFKKNVLKVVISVLLGIFTHFLWDNFTHAPNYVSPFYADFLLENIKIFGKNLPVYEALQLSSSIVGLAGFLMLLFTVKVDSELWVIERPQIVAFWFSVLIVSGVAVIIRYAIGVPAEKPTEQLLVISISGFLTGLTLISWLWQRRNKLHEN